MVGPLPRVSLVPDVGCGATGGHSTSSVGHGCLELLGVSL